MIDFKSVRKGIKAMTRKHGHVNYAVKLDFHREFWFEAWTPNWHDGRGPYITIGVYFISFLRGY